MDDQDIAAEMARAKAEASKFADLRMQAEEKEKTNCSGRAGKVSGT